MPVLKSRVFVCVVVQIWIIIPQTECRLQACESALHHLCHFVFNTPLIYTHYKWNRHLLLIPTSPIPRTHTRTRTLTLTLTDEYFPLTCQQIKTWTKQPLCDVPTAWTHWLVEAGNSVAMMSSLRKREEEEVLDRGGDEGWSRSYREGI